MKKSALLVMTLALGACAAPSSYDGLSGGAPREHVAKEDAALVAPRPLSPISVSLIASSRPHLKWELGATLTGAVIELSQTRDFSRDVKRFETTGAELKVPEDLALGVWFWRLKGSTVDTVGTTTSSTWEMVVRGPAAHGASDAPTRSMVDVNGDGEPDLLVGALVYDQAPASSSPTPSDTKSTPAVGGKKADEFSVVLLYAGDRDRGFPGAASDGWGGMTNAVYDGSTSIGGGTDFDGDGFTDVIESGVDSEFQQGKYWFQVNVIYASGKAPKAGTSAGFDYERGGPLFLGSTSPSMLPSVREGADVDGDGYGDALVGLADAGFVVLGGANGRQLPALLPLYPGPPSTVATSARAAIGAFDANGDGLADVAFGLADPYQPTAGAFAAAGDKTQRLSAPKMIDTIGTKVASAFAAGDYNGDGIDDMAISTASGTSNRVCIWFGDRERLLVPGPCIDAADGELELGTSLTAVDLEGDGVDELLATVKVAGVDGVRAIRLGGDGKLTGAPIGVPGIGVRLTTLWPGRPGKARWAAVAGDGSRIAIFDGADLRASLLPTPDVSRGFGRGLR